MAHSDDSEAILPALKCIGMVCDLVLSKDKVADGLLGDARGALATAHLSPVMAFKDFPDLRGFVNLMETRGKLDV
eukprot:7194250-Lingulodinium_polyedra.AAC.1